MDFEDFERRRVDVGEVVINCRIGGSGAPALMLHGYPQSLAMWTHVAPVLVASGRTVVCADLRGYGDSSKPPAAGPETYSFRSMARDQMLLMRELGFERFDVIGHDRGARTGHRMALDHPEAVSRLALLDIAPTLDMLERVDRSAALMYWHWYFLAQPAPFPERLIGADPDYFFETCFTTWGATSLDALDQRLVDEYRRCWRNPDAIRASCEDYRSAMTADLEHERADRTRTVNCPVLALWGAAGKMAQLYDLEGLWRARCPDLRCASLPGGHFFVDQLPAETAELLVGFLGES